MADKSVQIKEFNGTNYDNIYPKTTASQVSCSVSGISSTNVNGAMSELFTSVSNGKSAIASAITNKGVSTSSSDSFQTMANNINSIQTGIDFSKYRLMYHLFGDGYVQRTPLILNSFYYTKRIFYGQYSTSDSSYRQSISMTQSELNNSFVLIALHAFNDISGEGHFDENTQYCSTSPRLIYTYAKPAMGTPSYNTFTINYYCNTSNQFEVSITANQNYSDAAFSYSIFIFSKIY